MARRPDTSPQTLLVLAALLETPDAWHYGYDLSRRLGLRSGTLYPILVRLAERGCLETRWGELDLVEGSPARLVWALGGLWFVCTARRRALARTWRSWPDTLRMSAFGLVPGALLIVGIVWNNVVVPSHESDDEYAIWYLVFY